MTPLSLIPTPAAAAPPASSPRKGEAAGGASPAFDRLLDRASGQPGDPTEGGDDAPIPVPDGTPAGSGSSRRSKGKANLVEASAQPAKLGKAAKKNEAPGAAVLMLTTAVPVATTVPAGVQPAAPQVPAPADSAGESAVAHEAAATKKDAKASHAALRPLAGGPQAPGPKGEAFQPGTGAQQAAEKSEETTESKARPTSGGVPTPSPKAPSAPRVAQHVESAENPIAGPVAPTSAHEGAQPAGEHADDAGASDVADAAIPVRPAPQGPESASRTTAIGILRSALQSAGRTPEAADTSAAVASSSGTPTAAAQQAGDAATGMRVPVPAAIGGAPTRATAPGQADAARAAGQAARAEMSADPSPRPADAVAAVGKRFDPQGGQQQSGKGNDFPAGRGSAAAPAQIVAGLAPFGRALDAAGSAPAPLPPAFTFTSADLASVGPQVVRGLQLQLTSGGGDLRLTLTPEHLGTVTVEVRVTQDHVTAVLTSDTPEVRHWMATHQDDLRQSLSGLGLTLDALVVKDDGGRGRREASDQQGQEQQQQRREQQRRQRPTPTPQDEPVFTVVA